MPRSMESELPRSYGEGFVNFKPPGEMTAAMESLPQVRIPFPPIPKVENFQAQFGGGHGHSQVHHQYGGPPSHLQYGGGGSSHQYGGATVPASQYQYPQFHEVVSHGGDMKQDQGWRLPQFKRKEVDAMAYHHHHAISTPNTQTTSLMANFLH